DLSDIQGNVFGGFNTDFEIVISLTVPSEVDLSRAATWLSSLEKAVTTVERVRAERDSMKSSPTAQTPWLCVGLGARMLGSQADVYVRDNAFRLGMIKRAASVLGDSTDNKAWRVGSPDNPVDALLIVASNDEGTASSYADGLVKQAAGAGFAVAYR